MSRLTKIIRSEFKRANAKVFLFFLIFSTVLWLLLQFSKTYTEVVEIPLTFDEYPKDKLIENKGDKFRLEVEQNGFQLAWFNFFKPTVVVDLSELPADSTALYYNLLEHRAELARRLSIDMTKAEFLDKSIVIPYDLKSTKRVPVASRVKLEYAPGYSSEEPPVFVPDSVTISGPKTILDSITEVHTAAVTKKGINKNLTNTVRLESVNPKVTLYDESVQLRLKVEKFTEQKLEIPLTLINAPAGANINLFPASIKIIFMVSVKKYELVKPQDFVVVCDYSELSDDQNFFIPQLQERPDFVKNIMLSPKKIHYLIKR